MQPGQLLYIVQLRRTFFTFYVAAHYIDNYVLAALGPSPIPIDVSKSEINPTQELLIRSNLPSNQ